MTAIDPAALDALRAWDTPTICNALEVVIPPETVAKIPVAVDLLARREAVVLGAARCGGFDIDTLRRAMADSAEIH